jgi:hypothetical protein
MRLLEPLAGLKTQLGHIKMHIVFFIVAFIVQKD